MNYPNGKESGYPLPECPVCKSENVNWDKITHEEELDRAYQNGVKCDDCGATWREVFERIAIDMIKDKKGKLISNPEW